MTGHATTDHAATPRFFDVLVSSELLAQLLDEWSEPVEVQVVKSGDRFEMVFRRPEATRS